MPVWVCAGEAQRSRALRQRLERLGFPTVREVGAGPPAAAVPVGEVDVLVLALGNAERDALSRLQAWRERHALLPILAVVDAPSVTQRIQALDHGADDCVSDDVDDAELAARLRVRQRRAGSASARYLCCGPLAYDPVDRTVLLNGQPLRLSMRELELLEALIRRAGRLASPEFLQQRLLERSESASLNSVQVYVCRLRRKLRHEPVHISTVRGEGYRLHVGPLGASH
ncbi:response regulator transcription factor [Sphaerotilus microaerophilus]|jgi:DNA-binding response OmpR family regulator|uniref:Two-component system response regulator PhoP n=1 Tax=Sphaerotilus microaerophilus TaxID=2914710 RepID=A0ABN6PLB6_9BURK|nr:response regulator transcription factor [Sphaerotilus sp. FB-5]BDI04828.1 two-component system response regulator PhoP [Sphaerotilus sp. FB-5]